MAHTVTDTDTNTHPHTSIAMHR